MADDRVFQSRAIRVGYMAGRGIPAKIIGEHVDCSPALIRNALVLAGIVPPSDRGTVLTVSIQAESYIGAIDIVGRRHKMSREEVLKAVLLSGLGRGEIAIDDMIERGGFSNVR